MEVCVCVNARGNSWSGSKYTVRMFLGTKKKSDQILCLSPDVRLRLTCVLLLRVHLPVAGHCVGRLRPPLCEGRVLLGEVAVRLCRHLGDAGGQLLR